MQNKIKKRNLTDNLYGLAAPSVPGQKPVSRFKLTYSGQPRREAMRSSSVAMATTAELVGAVLAKDLRHAHSHANGTEILLKIGILLSN